jgi:hypothetical protein
LLEVVTEKKRKGSRRGGEGGGRYGYGVSSLGIQGIAVLQQ